jgi:AGZA family xanthine/uracil permease-like MFS transporter
VEAGAPIVFWIAIVITAQAFQATDTNHAPAVAIGLIPGIIAWGLFLIEQTLVATGVFTFHNLGIEKFSGTGLSAIEGLITLERGFMLTSTIWAAITVYIIDRDFKKASIWAGVGTLLSMVGLIHAYELTPRGTEYKFGFFVTPYITIGYTMLTGYLSFIHYAWKKNWVI